MENLISLQSVGHRNIGEPSAPRPIGVHQGSVLVVLDVNKGVAPAALYWALANVVRKGDKLKLLGIITHVSNAMGFMIRVDQSTWNSPNIMELQFEIATKKEAIWRTAHIKDWCQRAGVKLEVDVKAGNNPKVIAIDEAKSIGAYHVVLDKHMKKDKKYFVDNLSCLVSRIRSSGGAETIRSYATSSKLPPMAPTTPKGSSQAGHQSKASMGLNGSHRGGWSMSSTSFELGGDSSCDEFSFQEVTDPLSAPSTDESIERPSCPDISQLLARTSMELGVPKQPPNLYNLLRGPFHDGENGLNKNNPLRKPAVRKWLNEDDRINVSDLEQQGPLTPRSEFRFEQRPSTARGPQRVHHQQIMSNSWIGQINVAPEFGQSKMGRHTLTAQLRTQASFNNGRKHFRAEKISMDMHWPLMHWADCRAMKLRSRHGTGSVVSSSNSSMSNLRTAVRRRVSVSSGLNYSDMVDSD
ncbi:uncharacterized protein [Physcomitrium patens]|uniref:uncharacterized protein n=1 Tax=Physcomitrium patens TaxID=3218 RepID=UPI000D15B607|nr:uncharacterized protein LOC112277740 [Physcomitrium patens]|eukprot:XP_024366189.1 uncharacterized protein LOC112277740 [Physcomitrella patens]